MSRTEAYEILNLNPKKKYTNEQILNSYKKIMKKIHPDKNTELNRLAVIVNQAKDTLIKN
jgi:curved DNA-binding protein CbpA